MRDPEDLEFFIGHSDTAKHQPVAAERFYRVDTHAAHELFDLMSPCGHEVHEPLASDIGIKSLNKVGTLCSDTPVALAGLAGTAEVTSECKNGSRCDVASIRTESHSLDNVGRTSYGTATDEGNIVSDAFVAQSLVNACECEFDRDTHVIADPCRSGTRAASETVDSDYIRAASGDSARDGCDVMNCRNLDDDGLFVFGRFFKREDELSEVLDRINIVMRCG